MKPPINIENDLVFSLLLKVHSYDFAGLRFISFHREKVELSLRVSSLIVKEIVRP